MHAPPRCLLALAFLLAASTLLRAETNATEAIVEESLLPGPVTGFTDRHHHHFSTWFLKTADSLDRYLEELLTPPERRKPETFDQFLGDRRFLQPEQKSRLRLSPGLSLKDTEDVDVGMKVSAQLDLPRMEDRLDIIIQNFTEDPGVIDEVRNSRFAQTPLEEQSSGSVGLRLRGKQTDHLRTWVDGGLSFRPEPIPKVRGSLRLENKGEHWGARATQSVFWNSRDGFGEKTWFDLDYREKGVHLERLTTSVLWSETSDGVQAGQSLNVYRYLSRKRLIGGKVSATGYLEPTASMFKYTVAGLWRTAIHRNWIYMEIEPGVEFPDDRDWKETPFINIQFDILLGDIGD